MTADRVPANFRSAEGYRQLNALYDSELAKWGVPFETRHVATRFGKAYVIISGKADAPPLVLLHGGAIHSGMWQPHAAFLSQHFRMYAVDMPDQAGRSEPAKLTGRAENWTSWLADVLDGLKLEKPNVAGISLGGWLTLHFASAMPERVNQIMPMCPVFLLSFRVSFLLRTMAMAVFRSRRAVRSLIRYYTAPGNPVPEEVVDVVLLIINSMRLNVAVPQGFSDSALRVITAPTLVMIGDHEVIYNPHRALERAKRLIPNCEILLIPNCGHGINAEQPEVMHREMIRFLLP